MIGKFFKYVKLFLVFVFSMLLILVAMYLIKPNYIKEKIAPFASKNSITISECYLDTIIVEVPKSYELLQIAFSLTETFQHDKNLVDKGTTYYKDMDSHFSKFKNHKLITELDKYIKSDVYSSRYLSNRLLSLTYDISEDNKLMYNNMINFNYPLFLKLYKKDYFIIMENVDLINDFASKTNYIAFYNAHKSYYSKLIDNYNLLCDFKHMKNWLEHKFQNRVSSYRIIFSPLTGGFHNTSSLEDEKKGIKQSIMFVSAPDENLEIERKDFEIEAAQRARIVFTEIDHNYANIPNSYSEQLKKAMPNYKAWIKGKQALYSSCNRVFNEYMTWGVFNLYALDTYTTENADTIIQMVDLQMQGRGFNRFSAFNNKLLELYKAKSKPPINTLYEPMLEWVKAESAAD